MKEVMEFLDQARIEYLQAAIRHQDSDREKFQFFHGFAKGIGLAIQTLQMEAMSNPAAFRGEQNETPIHSAYSKG